VKGDRFGIGGQIGEVDGAELGHGGSGDAGGGQSRRQVRVDGGGTYPVGDLSGGERRQDGRGEAALFRGGGRSTAAWFIAVDGRQGGECRQVQPPACSRVGRRPLDWQSHHRMLADIADTEPGGTLPYSNPGVV
jgi:hypothetical protein